MASKIRLELQQNIARYINAEFPLSQFEDWFNPILWNLADSPDEPLREFAGAVSNVISECSDRRVPEGVLRDEMALAIIPFVTEMGSQPQVCQIVISKDSRADVNLLRGYYSAQLQKAEVYSKYLNLDERYESAPCLQAAHQ